MKMQKRCWGACVGVMLVALVVSRAAAQSDVRLPAEFEVAGSQLETLFTYFGGVASSSASIDPATVFAGNSCRLNIAFRPDANFTRAGAGFGTLAVTPPDLMVPEGADTFSITIQSPAQGTLTFKVTAREDDDADGNIDPDAGDDQWETEPITLLPGTNVYNLPLSAFTNVGSGNDSQNFSTTSMMAWFLTFQTDASYPGGMITVPVSFLIDHAGFYVGTQTIPDLPTPPQNVFRERWNSSSFGTSGPGEAVMGDEGAWSFSATDQAQPRAEITWHNASRTVRITPGFTASASLTRNSISIPMTVDTTLSFSAWSTLASPQPGSIGCTAPCGDKTFLRLTDNRGNQLVYVLDHAPAEVPVSTSGNYREIFLARGEGRYERSLLDDFSAIPNFSAGGAAITSIQLQVQNVGGAAVLDDLTISSETLIGSARGSQVRASGDSGGLTTITYVSSTGRSVVLQRSTAGDWTSAALDETAAGVPASVGANATNTWVDDHDGKSYVSVASEAGLMIVDTSTTPQGVRNLTQEIGTTTPSVSAITGPSTVFMSVDGFVNVMGFNLAGDMVRYFQTGGMVGGEAAWGFMNITTTQLQPNGIATPAIVSNLVPYISQWGGLHVAGLDAVGNIHAVWWAPGAPHWFANDLSTERGTPPLNPDAGLSGYVTPWGGLNLTGLDAGGRVVVLWWAPALGDGNWQNTDLTSTYAGPTLDDVGLATFVTPWGALNISGVTPDGELVNYWWVPGFNSWLVTSISAASSEQGTSRLRGGLSGLGSPAGTISIIGSSDNGDVIRYFWNASDGAQWHHENARELSERR
mgnify:CR=1 FL=1